MWIATVLGLSHHNSRGTHPKKANASTSPWRIGLGAFGGQRDGEGAVRVTPGDDQDGHLSATVGEVDVDVSEVGLEPMTGRVVERDERLSAVETVLLEVATDLVVAAGVVVLGDEPTVDLAGGVPLLGRGSLVGGEDVVDDAVGRLRRRERVVAW